MWEKTKLETMIPLFTFNKLRILDPQRLNPPALANTSWH